MTLWGTKAGDEGPSRLWPSPFAMFLPRIFRPGLAGMKFLKSACSGREVPFAELYWKGWARSFAAHPARSSAARTIFRGCRPAAGATRGYGTLFAEPSIDPLIRWADIAVRTRPSPWSKGRYCIWNEAMEKNKKHLLLQSGWEESLTTPHPGSCLHYAHLALLAASCRATGTPHLVSRFQRRQRPHRIS